jgi:hypothetical protein
MNYQWWKKLNDMAAASEIVITTTFYAFGNPRKALLKVQKPLPKSLRNGFASVGYTAVAYSKGQRFFTL